MAAYTCSNPKCISGTNGRTPRPPAPPSPSPSPAPYACTTPTDCELLGECVSGSCVCRPGFKGPSCGSVDLAPLSARTHGVVWPPSLLESAASANTTFSWGFTAVYDEKAQLYHAAVNVGCCSQRLTPPETCGVTVGGTLLAHVTSKFPDRGFTLGSCIWAKINDQVRRQCLNRTKTPDQDRVLQTTTLRTS